MARTVTQEEIEKIEEIIRNAIKRLESILDDAEKEAKQDYDNILNFSHTLELRVVRQWHKYCCNKEIDNI